ncbi:class I SAM-dependent methyltransferase [Kineosporia rhizophila]|uniref:class I SAM-dependent methyltransferase n=1 Tax=Kineosporia TaxID=49184 RepID=UPI001E2C96C2|nr:MULTISPECIES: class I SAM-dependent methyltransferase [Kineosporia]MCE0534234.1 class I SAM-dependent methyltransferase [Kineosporia rhizophila]GLY13782.1 putative methyltransferase [Kineosporia sp. NBRC 101677]
MTWEQQRVSFDANATTYDSIRPGWPAPTVRWLTGTSDRHLDVIDLGAGTGKLTRTLVDLGHRVTAVEPSPGMYQVLLTAVPQAAALQAPAEQIPLPDHSADVVTVAQAWHWFQQPQAALEIARVLRPGGLLAVAWHERDTDVPWVRELNEIAGLARTEQAGGRVHAGDTVVELPEPFGPLEHAEFEYQLSLTPGALSELASSWSYVDTHPQRAEIVERIERLGERVAAEQGTPQELALPHRTHCYRARTQVG